MALLITLFILVIHFISIIYSNFPSINYRGYYNYFRMPTLFLMSLSGFYLRLLLHYFLEGILIIVILASKCWLNLQEQVLMHSENFGWDNSIQNKLWQDYFSFGSLFDFCIDCIFYGKRNLNCCKLRKSNHWAYLEFESELFSLRLT